MAYNISLQSSFKSLKKRALPVLATSALLGAMAFHAAPPVVHAAELPVLTQMIKQNRDAVVHIQVEAGGNEKMVTGYVGKTFKSR